MSMSILQQGKLQLLVKSKSGNLIIPKQFFGLNITQMEMGSFGFELVAHISSGNAL